MLAVVDQEVTAKSPSTLTFTRTPVSQPAPTLRIRAGRLSHTTPEDRQPGPARSCSGRTAFGVHSLWPNEPGPVRRRISSEGRPLRGLSLWRISGGGRSLRGLCGPRHEPSRLQRRSEAVGHAKVSYIHNPRDSHNLSQLMVCAGYRKAATNPSATIRSSY